MPAEEFEVLRRHMLAEISATTTHVSDLIGKAALDERVMTDMRKVPRHELVPIELKPFAYANIPLAIGFNKTISQLFIVALMTDLLDVSADDAVLEIGTGLGYQAAILAQLAREVYSIEVIEELGQQAKQRLRRQGCTNVKLKIADGYHGWSEHAPFDKVMVTAAPDLVPPPLIHQLKNGGKMVVPAGLNHHLPPVFQLMDQRWGNEVRSRCHHDLVERCVLGPAMIAIRNLELDVGAALSAESLLGLLPELLDDLDAVHLPRQLGEDCGLIAETGADLEDRVISADIKEIRH